MGWLRPTLARKQAVETMATSAGHSFGRKAAAALMLTMHAAALKSNRSNVLCESIRAVSIASTAAPAARSVNSKSIVSDSMRSDTIPLPFPAPSTTSATTCSPSSLLHFLRLIAIGNGRSSSSCIYAGLRRSNASTSPAFCFFIFRGRHSILLFMDALLFCFQLTFFKLEVSLGLHLGVPKDRKLVEAVKRVAGGWHADCALISRNHYEALARLDIFFKIRREGVITTHGNAPACHGNEERDACTLFDFPNFIVAER